MARPRIGLRGQLALISLLMLVLPLAVLQYVRLVQQDLLHAQRQQLDAELQAMAMQITASEPLLQQYFPPPVAEGIRFLPLASRPLLDGSCDDWEWLDAQPRLALQAGYFQGDLFLCLRRAIGPASEESLRLEGNSIDLAYAWQSRGTSYGLELGAGQALRYETRAVWIAGQDSYQVELQVPAFLLGERLGLEVIAGGVETRALFGYRQGVAQRYYRQPTPQSSGLVANAQERLLLLAPNQLVLASQDRLSVPVSSSQSYWRSLLASLVAPRVARPSLLQVDSQGRVTELPESPLGDSRYDYVGDAAQPLLVLMRPVDLQGLRVGWLLSMRPAVSFSAGNLAALDRLMLNSVAVFLLIALVVLLYAGWLVSRVRRLERRTAGLLSRGNGGFRLAPVAGDELSQLAAQFDRMVDRLEGYTSYMQGLAGKLSHEIRTPLAIVSSSLDNLESSRDADEQLRSLVRAREGLQRLDRILGLMAQASSFEQLLDEVELEAFAPAPVLVELVQAYRLRYPEATISLHCGNNTSAQLAWGSADLMVQALDKLVDNAVDFATGEIRILLDLDARGWCLAVENDGPPLPVDMQDQLFDALVSVRKAASDQVHLGFGLQMVKRIAQKFAGSVCARNLPDAGGVAFCLYFPRAPSG